MYIVEEQPKEIKTWVKRTPAERNCRIFLAGTIDKGNSEDWQKAFIEKVAQHWEELGLHRWNYIFYNPRRETGFGDDAIELHYQYNWEQDRLKECDKIIMCILGTSKSPATLMELGQYLTDPKLTVICEPGFWRFDAVRLACERYGTKFYTSMDDFWRDNVL